SSQAAPNATASPITAPASSSYVINATTSTGDPVGPLDSMMTRMITGASLIPDSISSVAVSRAGSPSTRRVENTAAASVEETIEPSRTPVRQLVSSSTTAAPAVTATLTATPSVDSTTESGTAGRTAVHRVVRPPSV